VWCSPKLGSDHLHIIPEEISRVEELCIGQDMRTLSTVFMEMEEGSVNWL
jgi:hypothetical protein